MNGYDFVKLYLECKDQKEFVGVCMCKAEVKDLKMYNFIWEIIDAAKDMFTKEIE